MAEIQVLCGKCGEVLHGEKSISTMKCTNCGHLIDLSGSDDSEGRKDADDTLLADDEGFATQARSLMLPKVRTTCTDCGKIFSAEAGLAGREANCPACNAPVRVPYPGEDEIDPDATKTTAPEALDITDADSEVESEIETPAEESTTQDESPPVQPATADKAQATPTPTGPSIKASPQSRIETVDDLPQTHKSSKRPLLLSLTVAIVLIVSILLYFLC